MNRKNHRWLSAPIAALVLGVPLVSSALPAIPHTFASGDPIVASEINENFDHLHAGVEALERGSELCGTTGETAGRVTSPGGLVGYPAAASLCQSACASPTAHMCASSEIVTLASRGFEVPAGWVTTAGVDCQGWTNSSAGTHASWNGDYTIGTNCANTLPILCCD